MKDDVAIWEVGNATPTPDCFAFRLRAEWSRNDSFIKQNLPQYTLWEMENAGKLSVI